MIEWANIRIGPLPGKVPAAQILEISHLFFDPLYKESQLFFGPWAIILKSLKSGIEAMELEDFDHNLVRKVKAMDLPKEIKMRRKDEITALKIERLRRESKKRSGKDGDQATLELITELAWQRFEQLQDIDQAIDAAANS